MVGTCSCGAGGLILTVVAAEIPTLLMALNILVPKTTASNMGIAFQLGARGAIVTINVRTSSARNSVSTGRTPY